MPLITLDEAKAQLQLVGTTAYDDEITAFIAALTPVIERHIGPVENRTVTETVNAHGPLLALSKTPTVSLTSLTPVHSGGRAIGVGELALDGDAGVLRRLDGGYFAGGPWLAVYIAGRGPTVHPTIKLAARFQLQHLWRTKWGAARGNPGGGEDFDVNEPIPGMGYAVPNRVLQLLEDLKTAPGVA